MVSTALFKKLKRRTAKDSVKDTETYPQHSEQIMNLPINLIINPALTVYILCILQNARAHKNLTHLLVILHIDKYIILTECVKFWTLKVLVVVFRSLD